VATSTTEGHDPCAADHLVDIGRGPAYMAATFVAEAFRCRMLEAERLHHGCLSQRVAARSPHRRSAATPRASRKLSLVLQWPPQTTFQDLDLDIHSRCLVCITGVSGSGKSTLVNELLIRPWRTKLGLKVPFPIRGSGDAQGSKVDSDKVT